ncbi:MAG: hypothetical protein ACUVWP_01105 [bacterium]
MKRLTILLLFIISVGYVLSENIKIEAEGLSFLLPPNFIEVNNPHEGRYAPQFAKYYENDSSSLLVRVRKDDWGESEITELQLYAYASAYVANAIGHFPEQDLLMAMNENDYKVMSADGGVFAIYDLSTDQKQIQGFKFEILLMLMKKPHNVYLISYLYNELDDEWDICGKTLFNNLEITE